MPISASIKDEADAIAQIEKLTADLAAEVAKGATGAAAILTLTAERDTARTQVASVTTERDSARTQLATVTQERDTARTELATTKTERDDFKAKAEPVQKQLAAELSKHGIRKEAAQTATTKGEAAKLTPTERVLQAKGVSSIAELTAKK